MAALSKAEIREKLKEMPGWSHVGKSMQRKFMFKSFPAAMAFVNRIAEAAERAGHHPDINIRYSLVEISLWTHSEGGVTEKDFQLARQLDQIAGTISSGTSAPTALA
jgi:4a-hydroxytetrahydrobiopterin dehydratase